MLGYRFSEQIMSADKYPSIFSRQMEAIVYIFSPQIETIVFIILHIFYATRAVLKIGGYINIISIYTLSDLGVLSNLIVSLSLANEYYSPPTE